MLHHLQQKSKSGQFITVALTSCFCTASHLLMSLKAGIPDSQFRIVTV